MEKWYGSPSPANSHNTEGSRDIGMCDHADNYGVWCINYAEYILQLKDTDFPLFLCKKCFFFYYEDGAKASIIR